MGNWSAVLSKITAWAVLRWSFVVFVSLLEVLALILLTSWLVGYLR